MTEGQAYVMFWCLGVALVLGLLLWMTRQEG